jgi:phage terminase small subunit
MGQKRKPAYPDAPPHLSERSAALWRELGPVRMSTTGRQALFQAALEALDRAEAAREAIAQQGMVARTDATGALHVHPLLKVERDSRQQFVAIWRGLGLDLIPASKELEQDSPATMEEMMAENQKNLAAMFGCGLRKTDL